MVAVTPPGAGTGRADGRDLRWAEHRLERRRQILDAAIRVIERTPESEEIRVGQIAAAAGLGRPVVYRHFADRADLDRAVQQRILEMLVDHLVPQFRLTGTIGETIDRIVGAYVEWAAAHPELHRVGAAEIHEPGQRDAMSEAIGVIADLIAMLVTSGAAMLDFELSDDDAVLLRPLVFGIVGQAVGAVRFWLADGGHQPSADVLATHLSRSVWFQLEGHSGDRGLVLTPDTPLGRLFSDLVG